MNFDALRINELDKRKQNLLIARDVAAFLIIVASYIFMVTRPYLPLDTQIFAIYAEIPKNVSPIFADLGYLGGNKSELNPWHHTNEFILFDALAIAMFAAIYRRTYLFFAAILIAAIPKSLFFTSVEYRIVTFFLFPIIVFVFREQKYIAKWNFFIKIILIFVSYNVLLNIHYADFTKGNEYTGEVIKVPQKINKDFDEKIQNALNNLPDDKFSNEKNYIIAQISFIRGDYKLASNSINNIKNDSFAKSDISKNRLKLFREFAVDAKVKEHSNLSNGITWLGYLEIILLLSISIFSILSQLIKNRLKRISKLHGELYNLSGQT